MHRPLLNASIALLALFVVGSTLAASNNFSIDFNNYENQLRAVIKNRFFTFNQYIGQTCSFKIDMSRDGKINSITDKVGDKALCDAASDVVLSAKIPAPPSDEVWNAFKNAPLDFVPR